MATPTFHSLALACLIALSTPAGAADPPPVPVSVDAAVSERLAPLLWSPGSVVSRRDARIAVEQDGRVVEIAEVGTRLARGDVVARVDDRLLRLREAELRADLGRIEAQLAHARRQEERLQPLADKGTVSSAALDDARAQRSMLEQDLVRARASLDTARHRLANAQVKAPFDGVVAERFVERGEFLGVGMPVARLVDTGNLEVQARAPVSLAAHVDAGMRVAVRGGGVEVEQPVRAVVPVGDASSRQFELRIALDAPHWPVGTALEIGLPSEAPREVVAVPRDALLLRPDSAYVVRIGGDDVAQRVPVQTGGAQGDWVEVIGDVRPGDRLVVRGGERLAPGQKVRIDNLPLAAASAASAQP